MQRTLLQSIPQYEGDEPYAYVLLEQRDTGRAEPLLLALHRTGCRLWRDAGADKSAQAQAASTERLQRAALVIIFASTGSLKDVSWRSRVTYAVTLRKPMIALDLANALGKFGALQLQTVPTLPYTGKGKTEKTLGQLLRTQGFTRELMGAPPPAPPPHPARRALSIALLALAVAAVMGFLFFGARNHWFPAAAETPAAVEGVSFSDGVIDRAVRDSLGLGRMDAISESALPAITELTLSGVPTDVSELLRLPNLTKLRVPQAAVDACVPLLPRYTVVVEGAAA